MTILARRKMRMKALDKDLHSLMLGALEKAKARALKKGKGKGKSKAKGKKGNLAALTTGEGEEEEGEEDGDVPLSLEEGLKKLRKAKEMPTRTHSDFEEALKKVGKSPYLSKASLKDKQAMLEQLAKMLKNTKSLLEKGEKAKPEVLKKRLLEVVARTEDAKDEAKELGPVEPQGQQQSRQQGTQQVQQKGNYLEKGWSIYSRAP